MTFVAFVSWLASAAALGAISSFLFQALKALFPALKDDYAKIGSVVFAALLNVAAQQVLPILPTLPAWIEQLWPVMTWLWSQVVYELLVKPKPE